MVRPTRCKAVVVNQCSDDIFTAANLEDVALPALQSDQVLVKMLAAPINPSDYLNISGRYGSLRPTGPFVVGFEGVGEVVETGSDVTTVSVGDWTIVARKEFGTWREYGVCNSKEVIKIDKRVGFKAAATMTVNPTTAYFLLQELIKVQPGQTVIQNGANSFVGKSLIQIAKAKGIRTINVVRNRAKLKELVSELKELGADEVVTDEDLKTVTFDQKPVLAIDCVGGEAAALLISHLPTGGTLVNYGALSGQALPVQPLDLIFRDIKVCGYWLAKTAGEDRTRLSHEAIPYIAQLAAEGKFKLPQFDLFRLSDFKKGLERATAGFSNKKQLLIMDDSLME